MISPTQRILRNSTQHSKRERERDTNAFCEIRTRNPRRRTAADPRLRMRGHRHRPCWTIFTLFLNITGCLPLTLLFCHRCAVEHVCFTGHFGVAVNMMICFWRFRVRNWVVISALIYAAVSYKSFPRQRSTIRRYLRLLV